MVSSKEPSVRLLHTEFKQSNFLESITQSKKMLRDVGTTVNFVCDRWGRGVRKCLNLRDPIEGGQKSPTDGGPHKKIVLLILELFDGINVLKLFCAIPCNDFIACLCAMLK